VIKGVCSSTIETQGNIESTGTWKKFEPAWN